MADIFKKKLLGDICNMRYGKMPKKEDLVDSGGYPIFTGYLISGYHKDYMFKEPEIIVVARGIGGAGDIKISPPNSWITNISIAMQVHDCEVDKSYLYWKLCSSGLRHLRTGSAQPQIIIADLKKHVVELPPLPVQRKIAAILSTYDDLIENNLRRIKILEEMAQNLYREWFVNFRFPVHENARFVDSHLGRIPEGWEIKKLKDVLELKYGKALKKADRLGGDVPVYGSSGIVGFHNNYLVQGPGIIVGRKGNVGSVYWSNEDFYPIDTVYYVSSTLPLRFLYYELQNKNFINNDAAVPGLNRNQAYSLELVVPTDDVLAKFCRIADDFERQAYILEKKNQVLRQTRDLLLPKLISGEVDVSELDINVPEEVAI